MPPFSCVATVGSLPEVRAEGLAELVGDLILTCTGGTPTPLGLAVPRVNVQVFLNTNLTSRLVADPATEALLLIDDPAPWAQAPCLSTDGCTQVGTGTGLPYGTGGLDGAGNVTRNVYQSRQATVNSVVWLGISMDPPGTTTARVLRIKNIRANANQLGLTVVGPTQILMFVSMWGVTAVPITNPQQVVGLSLSGVSLRAQPASAPEFTHELWFGERFPKAFKKRPEPPVAQNFPGAAYYTESGFYNPAFPSTNGLSVAGLATQGTRLLVHFTGVPPGLQIYVSITATSASPTLFARLTAADSSGAGPYSATPPTSPLPSPGVWLVPISEGTGQAVYEILDSDPFSLEWLTIGVLLSGAGAPTYSAAFAPISNVTTASATAPLPRFANVPFGAPPGPTASFRDTVGSINLVRHGYTSPYSAGGLLASDPSAAHNAKGDTLVVARDSWGSLWVNMFVSSTNAWLGWVSGGGITQGVPAIAVMPNSTAYIAARDNWNSYWLTRYSPTGGFGSWIYLAGIFSTDPVMCAAPDGSLYIIGKDNWNSLWSGRYVPGSGFQNWVWGMGIVKGKPSVACGTDGAAYVAVRDMWDSLWMARVSGNTWTGWHYGGGIMSTDPQAASAGAGVIYTVIRDTWGGIWYRGFSEGTGANWQSWVFTGGILQDFSPAGVGGELYIAGRDPSNSLWWYRATTGWTWANNVGVAAGPLAAAPR